MVAPGLDRAASGEWDDPVHRTNAFFPTRPTQNSENSFTRIGRVPVYKIDTGAVDPTKYVSRQLTEVFVSRTGFFREKANFMDQVSRWRTRRHGPIERADLLKELHAPAERVCGDKVIRR